MPLILTLTDRTGRGRPDTRTLTKGSLSIGRANGNDWVLEDPERHLSKTHCMVSAEGGRFILTDTSTNGVYINGAATPTARDNRVMLNDGDEFRLGDYVIAVRQVTGAAAPAAGDPFDVDFAAAAPTPFARPDSGSPDPLGFDPLGDDFADRPPTPFLPPAPNASQLRAADPFDLASEARHEAIGPEDDLFTPRPPADAWRGPSQSDHVDAPMQAFKAPKAIQPRTLDDLDIDALLGDLPPGPASTPGAAWAPGGRATGSALPDGLDDLLGDPAPPAAPPPLAVPAPIPAPPRATPARPALDDLLGDSPFGEPEAPLPPPRVVPEPPRPAPVAAASPVAAPVPAGDAAALLARFLDGAGVPDLPLGGQDPAATLHAAGALFRIMVEGLRDVLMSRAAIKNELRVEQTVLRARNNNALKFSVTPEEAVAALLVPNRPGYKPPPEAAREAFDDIKSHELAVMAGVQTALMGLLKRFDPATLETRLQPGRLDSILPAARKARFWELFCLTYKELAREAEDDFQSVFGREFARAYDAQSRKL